MEIRRAGSQPSTRGPADWFTGTVRIDPLFQPTDPGRAAGAAVTFDGYGKPSNGGTVVLQIDTKHKCTITLDGATGQVTITSNSSRGRTAQPTGT